LIAPTITESIKLHKEIKKGLEDYTYLMHQRLAKRNISEVWKNAINNNHPILLIATPNFLGLPRKDIGTIILERESSSFYKKDSRPFVDFRVFAKFLAKYYQASIIFGDSMIRSETYHELETGMAIDYSKISFRNTSSVNVHIINHKKENLQDGQVIGMANGGNITVTVKDGKTLINGESQIVASVPASNGIVHVMDTVLLPK
jgi:primosomal protein N'